MRRRSHSAIALYLCVVLSLVFNQATFATTGLAGEPTPAVTPSLTDESAPQGPTPTPTGTGEGQLEGEPPASETITPAANLEATPGLTATLSATAPLTPTDAAANPTETASATKAPTAAPAPTLETSSLTSTPTEAAAEQTALPNEMSTPSATPEPTASPTPGLTPLPAGALGLDLAASAAWVGAGEVVTFTLVVTNPGPAPAGGVLTAQLPAGLQPLAAAAGGVTWTVPALAPGAVFTQTLAAQAAALAAGTPLTATAHLQPQGGGPAAAATAQVEAVPVAEEAWADGQQGGWLRPPDGRLALEVPPQPGQGRLHLGYQLALSLPVSRTNLVFAFILTARDDGGRPQAAFRRPLRLRTAPHAAPGAAAGADAAASAAGTPPHSLFRLDPVTESWLLVSTAGTAAEGLTASLDQAGTYALTSEDPTVFEPPDPRRGNEPLLYTLSTGYDYPLELPAGRGGLAPYLALSYLSPKDQVEKSHYSLVGHGWDLAGADFIDRDSSGNLSLRLRGATYSVRVTGSAYWVKEDPYIRLAYGETRYADGGGYIHRSIAFTATLPDGTAYYYIGRLDGFSTQDPDGDPAAPDYHPVTYQPDGPFCQDQHPLENADQLRWRRLPLTRVIDARGNRIDYTWTAQTTQEKGVWDQDQVPSGGCNYIRFLRLSEVRYNLDSLRVGLGYTRDRTDRPCGDGGCGFYPIDTLGAVTVTASSATGWQTVRSYRLVHSFLPANSNYPDNSYRPPNPSQQVMELDAIEAHTGSSSATTRFTYRGTDQGAFWMQPSFYSYLKTVHEPYGGQIQYSYLLDDWGHTTAPPPIVTGRTDSDTATGQSYAWSYHPVGDKNGNTGGYDSVWLTRPDGSCQRHYYLQDVPYQVMAGHESQVASYQSCTDNNSTVVMTGELARTETDWLADANDLPIANYASEPDASKPRRVAPSEVREYEAGLAVHRTVYSYDEASQGNLQYGNVTRLQEYEGTGSSGWATSAYRDTQYTFTPDGSAWLIRLPVTTEVRGSDGVRVSQQAATYTAGLPTRLQTNELSGGGPTGASIARTYVYSSGNLSQETDENNHTTQYVYDSRYQAFRVCTVNAAGQPSRRFYFGVPGGSGSGCTVGDGNQDAGSFQRFGLLQSEQDANLATNSYTYDDYGRLTQVTLAPDTVATRQYSYRPLSEIASGQPFWVHAEQKDDNGGDGYRHTWRFYDGFGRTLQEQSEYNGSYHVEVSRQFDFRDHVTRENVPQLLSGAVTSSASYRAPGWSQSTQTAYDLLGRVTTVSGPDNTTTTTSYAVPAVSGNNRPSTTLVDANGHQTVQIHDGDGRLMEVEQYAGDGSNPAYSLYASTWYQNDPRNLLTGVTDAAGNQTAMTYDSYGRKVAMTDPSLGHWEYRYDPAGNLSAQKDARNQITCFYYDVLNRLLGKSYVAGGSGWAACPTGSAATISYTYDSGTGGYQVGRRSSMSDPSGSTAWTYDARGRVSSEVETIALAGIFTTTYTYRPDDQVSRMTYPDGEVITYTYTAQGLTAGLARPNGQTAVVDSAQYDAARRLTALRFPARGNAWQTQSYYGWDQQGGRLQTLRVGSSQGGADWLNLGYSYDPAGNVQTQNDAGQTTTFGYDELDRLTAADGQYTARYTYDNVGRLLTKSEGTSAASLAYPATGQAHALAPASVNGQSYGYDLNGNLTLDGRRAFTYTLDNRLGSVVSGTLATTLTYDGDGNLVAKTTPDGITVYVGQHYEVTLPAAPAAVAQSAQASLTHADRESESEAATTVAAAPLATQSVSALSSLSFTGPGPSVTFSGHITGAVSGIPLQLVGRYTANTPGVVSALVGVSTTYDVWRCSFSAVLRIYDSTGQYVTSSEASGGDVNGAAAYPTLDLAPGSYQAYAEVTVETGLTSCLWSSVDPTTLFSEAQPFGISSNQNVTLDLDALPWISPAIGAVTPLTYSYATQEVTLLSTTSDGSGDYSLGLAAGAWPTLPASGRSWQGFAIVESLPGGYSAQSASAPSPGQSVSAMQIRYPWDLAAGTYGHNDFAVLGTSLTFAGQVSGATTGIPVRLAARYVVAGSAAATADLVVASTTTDSSGRYSLSLAPGSWPTLPANIQSWQGFYLIETLPSGYSALGASAPSPGQSVSSTEIGYPFNLAAGPYAGNDFVVLGTTVTFTGQVTGAASGIPLRLSGRYTTNTPGMVSAWVGVSVTGYDPWTCPFAAVLHIYDSAGQYVTSSESGGGEVNGGAAYVTQELAPGSYQAYAEVTIDTSWYRCLWSSTDPATLFSSAQRFGLSGYQGVVFDLSAGPWVSVDIGAFTPLPFSYAIQEVSLQATNTDGDGSFTLSVPSSGWPALPSNGRSWQGVYLIESLPGGYSAVSSSAPSSGQSVSASEIRYAWQLANGLYPGNNFLVSGINVTFNGQVTGASASVPVRLAARYAVAGSASASAEVVIASTTTGSGGSFSLSLSAGRWPALPANGQSWQGFYLVATLPASHRALSSSAPSPGQSVNATEIRYPWALSSNTYANNTFALASGPVTLAGQVSGADEAVPVHLVGRYWGNVPGGVSAEVTTNAGYAPELCPFAAGLRIYSSGGQYVGSLGPAAGILNDTVSLAGPLAPGSYQAYADAGIDTTNCNWSLSTGMYSDLQRFAVSAAQTTTLSFGLYAGGATIPVISAADPLPYLGQSNADLTLQSAATGSAGHFSFTIPASGWPALPSGGLSWVDLHLVAQLPASYAALSSSAPSPGQSVSAGDIRYPWGLADGTYANNIFRVVFTDVRFSGQVSGALAAGVPVRLVARYLTASGSADLLVAATTTDSAGHYGLTLAQAARPSLPAGAQGWLGLYLIESLPGAYRAADATPGAGGQRVSASEIAYAWDVAAGIHSGNNFTTSEVDVTWTGRVSGARVAGVPVRLAVRSLTVSGGSADIVLATTASDSSGAFSLRLTSGLWPAQPANWVSWQGLYIITEAPSGYRVAGTTEFGYAWNVENGTYAHNDFVTAFYATKYYMFGGRRIAMQSTEENAPSYLLADALGSTVGRLTPSSLESERYYPYGNVRAGSVGTVYQYTGQRRDAALGLYDYGARWYDSYLNLWTQPDTIVPQPGDPQSLNRYAYARNNPLRYNDPTGHYECEDADECEPPSASAAPPQPPAFQMPLLKMQVSGYGFLEGQGGGYYHPGVDYGAGGDPTVRASTAGTVVIAAPCPAAECTGLYGKPGATGDDYNLGLGNVILVEYAWGAVPAHVRKALDMQKGQSLLVLYAHLKNAPAVMPGSRVSAGQAMGVVGNTGNSRGAHLHVETRIAQMDALAVDQSPVVELSTNWYPEYDRSSPYGKMDPNSYKNDDPGVVFCPSGRCTAALR